MERGGVGPRTGASVTPPAVLLMVLGGLTLLINGIALARVLAGEGIELEALQASVESTPIAIGLSAAGTALGLIAVAAGIGVLRRSRSWRVAGLTVAVVSAGSTLFNIVKVIELGGLGTAIVPLAILVGWVWVLVGLARVGAAFRGEGSGLRTALVAAVTVLMVIGIGVGVGAMAVQTVTAILRDHTIELAPTSASAGFVTFDVTNEGPSDHEFLVFETSLAPDALPIDPYEAQGPGTVDPLAIGRGYQFKGGVFFDPLPSGGTHSLDLDLEPGSYAIICNIHYQEGMATSFTVT